MALSNSYIALCIISAFIISCLILPWHIVAAQDTTLPCPPQIIPNTFELSYASRIDEAGYLYLTYKRPSLAYRHVEESTCSAEFTISFAAHELGTISASNITYLYPGSSVSSTDQPLVYPTTGNLALGDVRLTFTVSSTVQLRLEPPQDKNIAGDRQIQVTGTITCGYDISQTDCTVTTDSTTKTIAIASPSIIAMPDLFQFWPCRRLDVEFDYIRQLSAREMDKFLNMIRTHVSNTLTTGATAQTNLLDYTVTPLLNSSEFHQKVSFCARDGEYNLEAITPEMLIDHFRSLSSTYYTFSGQVTVATSNSKIPSYCVDNVKNFSESDIDCGGMYAYNGCAPCLDSTRVCSHNDDCVSGKCIEHTVWGKRCASIDDASLYTYNSIYIIISLFVTIILSSHII